jgi:hypothetical protein
MTQIQDWAGSEEYLVEFEDVWAEYRHMVSKGVTTFADVQVRDLFQKLSIIQAHSEMRLSVVEAARDAEKVALHLVEIRLLRIFDTGAMNKRMSEVESDDRYKEALEKLSDTEDAVTVAKGSAKATSTAANALSREISARLKG